MCWVMPPASPETTLVLRMASSSEVLPWSTWPMMVTTGGRGMQLAGVVPEAWTITSSTSDSETRLTRWPNSSTISAAVSASMVWFCVAMMPFCIRVLTTAATRSAMRLASSCTVIASGICTSRTTFSRSPEWLARRRFSRSWRRFIAASERWRPSSSVALAMVSLPERRRSSSPCGGRASPRSPACRAARLGATGRPASARAACGLGGGGVDRVGGRARGRRRLRPGGGAGGVLGLLGGRGGGALLGDLALADRALGGLLLGAQPRQLGLARLGGLALLLPALGLLRLGGLDRLPAALELGVAQVLLRGGAGRAGPEAAPGLGTTMRLRLCSTVTDFERPWLKLWRTWLVSVPPPRRPSVLPLRSPSLVSIIPSSLSRGGRPPPYPRRPRFRTAARPSNP